MEMMISVDAAKKIIEEKSVVGVPVLLPLSEAGGSVLAEDLFARIDIPSFPQSSMDGYAFLFSGWIKGKCLQVSGEMAAGSNRSDKILPGEAIRIFTGAVVPQGADTVLMQEKSKMENGELLVADENLQAGDNVRPQGAEIKKGSLALEKSTHLTPACIGYLAAMGYVQVPVYPKPVISIIVTGNELQPPGQPLQSGQIYEANSFSLAAALQQWGILKVKKYECGDNLKLLSELLKKVLRESDLVLLTGGVSVGDYDFTRRAAEECGVESLFHQIKQKPGKPIYFGKKGDRQIFGLPGNPASVLTCFYLYVVPVLEKYMGMKSSTKITRALSGSLVKKPSGITWFLKGNCEGGIAKTLDGQESYKLSSFAVANCLIQIEEDRTLCKPGDPVDIHLLPL
jgi:molybdopterin molybdotransferase